MRWFWFATFTLVCALLSVIYRQPLILLGELLIIELFIARKIKVLRKAYRINLHLPVWIHLPLWILLTVGVVRILAFDSLTIRYPSVRPTLSPGDNILISKLIPGPRLPMTPVGIPFCRQEIPFTSCTASFMEKPSLPYRRLPGLRPVRKGDLLAFNFPEGDSVLCGYGSTSYYSLVRMKVSAGDTLPDQPLLRYPVDRRQPEVNRCMGLPGDTVIIRNGRLVSSSPNGYPDDPERLSFDYLVETGEKQLDPATLERLGLPSPEIRFIPALGYMLPLQPGQLKAIRIRPEVLDVAPYLMEPGEGDYNIFPHDARYPWNRDNFGPVIVPRKGDRARLSLENLCIYRRIIEVYEQNKLEIQDGHILINGMVTDSYTFRQNYYFVLGDNRHHSRDSRHWGFLPEDHLIGVPLFIWFSWNRIFNTTV